MAVLPSSTVPIESGRPFVIWLGLAPILVNFLEVLLHVGGGVAVARARYSPGLVTVLPWLVLSIWYISEITSNDLVSSTDWWAAVAYLVAFVVIFVVVGTYVLLADKNSPYAFAPEEMNRFEKYRHLVHRAVHPHPEPAT